MTAEEIVTFVGLLIHLRTDLQEGRHTGNALRKGVEGQNTESIPRRCGRFLERNRWPGEIRNSGRAERGSKPEADCRFVKRRSSDQSGLKKQEVKEEPNVRLADVGGPQASSIDGRVVGFGRNCCAALKAVRQRKAN